MATELSKILCGMLAALPDRGAMVGRAAILVDFEKGVVLKDIEDDLSGNVTASVTDRIMLALETACAPWREYQKERSETPFVEKTRLRDEAVSDALTLLAPAPPDPKLDADCLVLMPFGTGDAFVMVPVARELGLWCDYHEQAYQRWGEGNAVCFQCLDMLGESLTASQWKRLIESWLNAMQEDDKAFLEDIVEGMSNPEIGRRELSRRICAVALIHGVTLREAVEQKLSGYL